MLRIILGVIAGFIVWMVLWGGSDTILKIVSPDWWGRNLQGMEDFAYNNKPFKSDSTIMFITLIRGIICSIAAGFSAAFVAKENNKSTLILGVLLLAVGIYVQWIFREVAPLWYHLSFLILLIPMTILGGKLAKR
jgi:membrane protein YdbS with pleckstrin-like domain